MQAAAQDEMAFQKGATVAKNVQNVRLGHEREGKEEGFAWPESNLLIRYLRSNPESRMAGVAYLP
jgi:hypothetical protein